MMWEPVALAIVFGAVIAAGVYVAVLWPAGDTGAAGTAGEPSEPPVPGEPDSPDEPDEPDDPAQPGAQTGSGRDGSRADDDLALS